MTLAQILRAMPQPQAVVAFLRACRTFDEVGDIDGPWANAAARLLFDAVGVADMNAYCAWEDTHTQAEVLAAYDRAIAAAEALVP